ncbi:hypothetical protein RUM43_014755 [Polyplax serrata]|uniref:Actin-related protein 5 n=1 Tax=Polyplax serrata TaxID=468196 RepID=A0AAN8NXT5_POLSC
MNTYQLKDVKTVPDIVHEYSKDLKNNHVPIIIDNGSCMCRVGWATQNKPKLIYRNLIAKSRRERGKKESSSGGGGGGGGSVGGGGGEPQIGNEIVNIEAVRFQLKMQFDRNIVTHMEAQEQLLDYAFLHLGIDTDGRVDHPILLTEPFLNLNYCRQMMSELLFECYNVPAINYSVDALLSYTANSNLPHGLILSFGYHTTHIIPVLNGKCDSARSRRINLGGFHIINYLHRLLQLKYPAHVNAITISRAEELVHDHTFIALDYQEELKKWAEPVHYDENVHIIQLPYAIPVAPNPLAEEEETLQNLLNARELYEEGHMKEFSKALHNLELMNIVQLNKQISVLEMRIEKIKQKIIAANTVSENIEEQKPKPVSQIYANAHANRYIPTVAGPKDRENFDVWLADIKQQRQQLLAKRLARRQRKKDLAQRRTAAAQERMRLISQLARKDKKDDNFGSRDEDWDVYKAINKDAGSSDSEEETERLNELEEVLKHHDPAFDCGNNDESMEPGESHQLHVGIERIRAPEVLFQPALVGNVEAGLSETIEFVLKRFTREEQCALVSNVFLTGGCASFPGLRDRLERELMQMRPHMSSFNVVCVNDPVLAAWNGGRMLALHPEFSQTLLTKSDYEEKGSEYFKEHKASNFYFPSPVATVHSDTSK